MTTVDTTLGCLAMMAGAVTAHAAENPMTVTPLPALPDAHGFAGCFAGVIGDRLIVAGGANFPDGVMPWRGGKKVWHDSVYALDLKASGAEWRRVGTLPKANGYGVSIATNDGLILIGGGNASENCPSVTQLKIAGNTSEFTTLPPLPAARANACGVLLKRTIHVIGGLETPASTISSNSHFILDLDHPERGWQEGPPLPGKGIMLATAAATDDGILIMGGCSLRTGDDDKPVRTYQRNCQIFSNGQWLKCPDLPRAAVGAASPAWTTDGKVLLVGGDDGIQVGVDPETHKGFCSSILTYDLTTKSWSEQALPDQPLPVTLPSACHEGDYILVSGEIRPGVRTPVVTKLTRKNHK